MTQNVIYRKYRPASFDEVIGQEHVTTILSNQIKNDSLSHAYLFTGPRGTGKTTVARILAREVNRVPKDINTDEVIDIVEIDAASNRGIDEIRDLKEKINFVPTQYDFKVYIIDEVHMLTKEAFNALLKTLEEPPRHAKFILATTESHKVPLTILSRTTRFDFKLGSKEQVKSKIEKILSEESIKVDSDALEIIIRHGGGSYRDTESILGKVLSNFENNTSLGLKDIEDALGLSSTEILQEFIDSLHNKNLDKALECISKVKENTGRLDGFINQLLFFVSEEIINIIDSSSSKYEVSFLAKLAKVFSKCQKDMKGALSEDLQVQLAILELVGLEEEKKPVEKIVVQQYDTSATQNVSAGAINSDQASTKEKKMGKQKEKVTKSVKEKKKQPEQQKPPTEKLDTQPNLTMIKNKWKTIVKNVQGHNHHLAAFLFKANPVIIEDKDLVLHVPFAFHKKKLSDTATRELIENIIADVCEGMTVFIRVEINKQMKPSIDTTVKKSTNKDIVEDIFDV